MAQNSNSSEIEDIISKSDLVCPGPPKIYQLKTKKEKIKSLTKITVGEKNENKLKTILLVGETGAGKSNLVNALFNYAVGVKFDDEIWFQIVEEEEDRSQAGSRTSDAVVYQIYGSEDQTLPFSLTIIDTPGYGDAGLKQQLRELFQSDEGIHEVHAVGLVIEEGGNVVSDQLKNIYDFILSLFGKDVEKNIIALLTNSNGKQPKKILQALEAANIKCAKNEKNQTVYFQFDNCQDEERTEDSELSIEYAWKVTERGMKQLTAFLGKSSPQQKKVMMEAQKEQIRLTACIQNLQERIKFIELKLRDVRMTQEAHHNNRHKWKNDKKLAVTIPETYKEKEPLTDKRRGFETAFCCETCKENCHYPGCTIVLDSQQCEVMINGECTSCTNKCSAGKHGKNIKFVFKTKKVQKNKEELKEYYRQKQGGGEKKLSKRLETEEIELKAEKRRLIKEAYRLFIKLYELDKNDDSNDDSASTYVILDYLIKKMKGQGHKKKLKKLEEIYSRMDQGTRSALQHRIGMISSNQEALKSESAEIHRGPPSIYQLIAKKEMIGTLTRVTVGEKDENKINKTILLVGETGAGKSTMINALFNYAVGVKLEDEIWFEVVEKEEGRSQSQSQTSDVIVYQISGLEGHTLPFSLTIIDTPGFGSTDGNDQDLSVGRRLFDLFRSENGVHEINAVCLVMKASDNKLSDRLMYVFDSVMSLFGKDLEKNIIILVTHSDGKPPENVLKILEDARIKCSTDEMNQPGYFIFNNQQIKQRNRTEIDQQGSKYSWDFTNEEMGRLKDFLKKTKPQPLNTTVEVLNERVRLTACIQNLQDRIKDNELNQNEIKQIEEAYNKHEEMKENQNFTIEVDEAYKEKETINGGMWGLVFLEGAVTCSVCEENCHYPGCTMAWYPEHCEVMNWGHCTVCTKKCPASDHVKENSIYVTKTRKVYKTLEDVTEKYENIKQKSIKLTKEWSSLLDEAYSHVTRLDQIALSVYSGFTFDHLVFLIEKMKERGDKGKVQVLEELKIRMEKETERRIQWKRVKKMLKENLLV